jgi:hypothetical protein
VIPSTSESETLGHFVAKVAIARGISDAFAALHPKPAWRSCPRLPCDGAWPAEAG